MYTDGYYDQFGGVKFKSMGSIKFKDVLLDAVNNKKTNAEFFEQKFKSWMGNQTQIDDVLVMGFKV